MMLAFYWLSRRAVPKQEVQVIYIYNSYSRVTGNVNM
jgi:hypothetical protein